MKLAQRLHEAYQETDFGVREEYGNFLEVLETLFPPLWTEKGRASVSLSRHGSVQDLSLADLNPRGETDLLVPARFISLHFYLLVVLVHSGENGLALCRECDLIITVLKGQS